MKQGFGLRTYTIIYLLVLYGPIIILPMFAFNDATTVAFPLTGFTTKWFGEMLADANLRKALVNSLIVSLSTATLATTLGILAARSAVRYSWPGKGFVMGSIMVPLVLPEMIVAMALLVLLLAAGIKLSLFTIILGHVLIAMPFAVAILSSAFQSLDKSLEEAALDLGASHGQVLRRILLPHLTPALAAGGAIAFFQSIENFNVTLFTRGTSNTLTVYVFSKVRSGITPTINALALMLIVMTLFAATWYEILRRRRARVEAAREAEGRRAAAAEEM